MEGGLRAVEEVGKGLPPLLKSWNHIYIHLKNPLHIPAKKKEKVSRL